MDNINPDKYYTPREISLMKVLPWSLVTFRKRLYHQEWIDIFDPLIERHTKTKRIFIKGSSIIKFLNNAKLATIQSNYEKDNQKSSEESS